MCLILQKKKETAVHFCIVHLQGLLFYVANFVKCFGCRSWSSKVKKNSVTAKCTSERSVWELFFLFDMSVVCQVACRVAPGLHWRSARRLWYLSSSGAFPEML